MSFEVGDRVGWIDSYGNKDPEAYGTIRDICTETYESQPYLVVWHDMDDHEEQHEESDLYYRYVRDTKIARKVYKNKIVEIKDGKLWVK